MVHDAKFPSQRHQRLAIRSVNRNAPKINEIGTKEGGNVFK